MSAKKEKITARVVSSREIAPGIFDLLLETSLAGEAHAGQFIGVYPHNESLLLPRPVSICEVDRQRQTLRLVYRIAGSGTAEFATLKEGDPIQILGILGNGFPLEKAEGKKVVLMGGGIGIPPMLETARELQQRAASLIAVLGYRDAQLFLKEEMENYAGVYVATEDGSAGVPGNVLTVMEERNIQADVIMACGPMPMLRAIKKYAAGKGIRAYISLEERMACGVGACLGCVCKTIRKDAHSHVNNARICTDGPVFDAEDVEI